MRTFIEVTTIGDLVDRAASETGGDAVVFPEQRVTYPELAELTDHFARALRGLGVEPGEKVGILMPNCMDFVAGVIGAAKLGAIAVPINGRFKAFELTHVVSHADIAVLLTRAGPEGTADFPAMMREVFPEISDQDPMSLDVSAAPELRQVVDMGGDSPGLLDRAGFFAAAAGVPESDVKALQERVRVRDIGVLMYTSGTTSKPKGCLLTHESVVRHSRNVCINRFLMDSSDAFWDPLPLFHIGGLVPMLGCFNVRAKYCHAGHFDPDVALRMLQDERCTILYPAFETIWLQVLNLPDFEKADLGHVRLVQNIAVPEALWRMHEKMPWASEVTSYGATECSSNLTLPHPDDPLEVRMETLGHTVPGMEAKIVNPETREELPRGEVGELCFRGYARFEGYYKDPEKTAETIDSEGWFHSADLASMDEQGRLRFAGRLKDMLKVGGENVSALEVEGYLATHDAVSIAQVVGAPDSKYGEIPAAYVQLMPGQSATEEEIIEHCKGNIASYKVPRYVRFVDEWPMSGTKIKKYELREQIAAEVGEG